MSPQYQHKPLMLAPGILWTVLGVGYGAAAHWGQCAQQMWCRVVLAKQETVVYLWGTLTLLLLEQPLCSKDTLLHYLVTLRQE